MYSLDCSYFKEEFETLDELIDRVMYSGMDPSYEITENGKGTGEYLEDFIVF
jgi:urate oxidase